MKLPRKIFTSVVLTAATLFTTAGLASAQGDLYYMHNASAYYLWSDYDTCESDLSRSGLECPPAFDFSVCGRYLVSTIATRNIAADKLKRNEEVLLRHTSTNEPFCRITP